MMMIGVWVYDGDEGGAGGCLGRRGERGLVPDDVMMQSDKVVPG